MSTLVPIKMFVSSLTELHTPRQTLGFSTVSKEQPLFKSVARQNLVFQPILTATMVTVNIGWNTGFSPINNLYKGCSLLTVLKTSVWRGNKLKDTTLTYIPKIHSVSGATISIFQEIRGLPYAGFFVQIRDTN